MREKYKFDRSYREILKEGTATLLITFGAGAFFGRDNMMIAFVIALGSSTLALQNLKIKTAYKTLRLILTDILIVLAAYVASLNLWGAIALNLVMIFWIVYLNVTPYNPLTYKTFLMLYVFCQYTSVSLQELPNRLIMVLFIVMIVVGMIYYEQRKFKALLPPQVGKAFKLLEAQLGSLVEGHFDETLSQKIAYQMNELAYVIYGSSFRRYFTTYIGKVHFHFYLNISYFNLLLEQMKRRNERGLFKKEELIEIHQLFQWILAYFDRKITRKALIQKFDDHMEKTITIEGFKAEVWAALHCFRKAFAEMDEVSSKKKDKIYNEWERGQLTHLRSRIKNQLNAKSMSFNFAVRMAITITIGLFLANVLGFYKFIWMIIPIMSIAQPYYEDTKKRGLQRLKSNILAAVILTMVLDLIPIRGVGIVILVLAFYLYYAYKDYYHTSIFLTVISMSIASVSMEINALLAYRIIYVVLGVMITVLTSRIRPYQLEDGINELVAEMERLNNVLEKESLASLGGKANLNRIREATVYSAVLSQKLYMKNKQYKSEKVDYLIRTNAEFVIRLGHHILRD